MMTLSTLFQNLREWQISTDSLESANSIFPSRLIATTKHCSCTAIDSNAVDELWQACFEQALYIAEPEFAATKMFGGSTKKKKCAQGYNCGSTCISTSRNCRKALPEQAKKYTEFLTLQNKDTGAKTPKSKSKKNIASSTIDQKPKTPPPEGVSPQKEASTETQDPRIHSIKSQSEFENAALYAYKKLQEKYGDLVPIHELREALGETVQRNKFDEYLLEMQGKDILSLKSGENRGLDNKIAGDSIKIPGGGIRTYLSLDILKEDLDSRLKGKEDKLNKTLTNPPKLDPLGTARELTKGPKIKSQQEFDQTINKAYEKLDSEFKLGGRVSIAKLREVLSNRVSEPDFDKYLNELGGGNKYQLEKSSNPTPEEEKGALNNSGVTRHIIKKL